MIKPIPETHQDLLDGPYNVGFNDGNARWPTPDNAGLVQPPGRFCVGQHDEGLSQRKEYATEPKSEHLSL